MDTSIQKLSIWKLIISIIGCELTGVLSSILSNAAMNPWFDNLNKPSWNPPSAVFGPVWSILYLLMGISLWLVWKSEKPTNEKEIAVTFFIIQLFLNFWWSLLFFKFHSPELALVDITLLLILILVTIIQFFPISKTAAYILIPYLLWVAFATILNASILILNS
ncbi:TspO/MBR family protein [Cytophaga aurantiaca]|uniref:TspO/MBR family protein n=1 Tax=Cytophaga aurantiaca TaxID=29530 RepID=UPI0003776EAC|nr:TspO/MBR family protein [Cytophaga aurantiaca]